MVREAGEAEGAEEAGGAGGEVFWLGCLIMVNYPDLILSPQGGNSQKSSARLSDALRPASAAA